MNVYTGTIYISVFLIDIVLDLQHQPIVVSNGCGKAGTGTYEVSKLNRNFQEEQVIDSTTSYERTFRFTEAKQARQPITKTSMTTHVPLTSTNSICSSHLSRSSKRIWKHLLTPYDIKLSTTYKRVKTKENLVTRT